MATIKRALYVVLLVALVYAETGEEGEKTTENNAVTEIKSPRKNGRKYRHKNGKNGEGVCQLEVSCKGAALDGDLPVKLPIKGPRGPPGKSGEKGERGLDGMPGIPGMPGVTPRLPPKVAFFVGLSDNMGPVTRHTDIIFDRVVTNIGSGYQPESGRFVAPVNATYQFNVIVSAQGRQKAAVMIIKNGAMIATVWAESIPFWATASNIVVLSLDKGDQVWLMLLSRASYLHGYMYTTFSGFLIFEN